MSSATSFSRPPGRWPLRMWPGPGRRLLDATLYLPAGLFRNCFFRLRLRPADHCCSGSCCGSSGEGGQGGCRCCDCCDLRMSVCAAAGWQTLIGGILGVFYTVFTALLVRVDKSLKTIQMSLMIYLLAYWWLYFLSGIVGCCVVIDTQGILTYEPRVIVTSRAYVALTVLCTLGHLNLIGLDHRLWENSMSRSSIFLTLLPLLWDWYLVYLAWSLLRKLQEQRKGVFRGKPVMLNQRKPEHVLELHAAHHLALQPPHPQGLSMLRGLQGQGQHQQHYPEGEQQQRQQYLEGEQQQIVIEPGVVTGAAAAAADGGGGGNGDSAVAAVHYLPYMQLLLRRSCRGFVAGALAAALGVAGCRRRRREERWMRTYSSSSGSNANGSRV
ncbi:hypothetical protein Agub_g2589 [Astrephomene gubernaculifera]|uniref:Uncharacterized protein n=1 Tax=Astrephomene gubernaculifera TaxID=47775 RepID=A0AAD3DJY8_9CHLO|nr:hypothetical protein Agub_g2589 [Astrephomene gubernaculifera]